MFLRIRVLGEGSHAIGGVLSESEGQAEEFWFGRGLAWAELAEERSTLNLSLLVDTPKVVARTKRRDREIRFGVGYCDAYTYSGCGLMAVFLAALKLDATDAAVQDLEVDFVSYPDRPFGTEVAERLFRPLGWSVHVEAGTLKLRTRQAGRDALQKLPALLLAIDRRTRLFLDRDELAEVGRGTSGWAKLHPASRAIELALSGRPTPLRYLRNDRLTASDRPDTASLHSSFCLSLDPLSSALFSEIRLDRTQREFAAQAFGRINIDLNWLVYLPSGIASIQAENESGELERPESALAYFRDERVRRVVVEEKHMGSRGIVVLCRSLKVARERFGVDSEIPGCAYTRNGRRFFSDDDTAAVFLERLGQVLTRANFWSRLSTGWVCLDGEILPWAVKAAESSEESDLVTTGNLVLAETEAALKHIPPSAVVEDWRRLVNEERSALGRYDAMFKRYRSAEINLDALQFAPFHLLATEGRTYFNQSHLWHVQTLNRLARSGNGFLIPTRYELVETAESKDWSGVLRWWEELSSAGAEGVVVKPLPFVPEGRRGRAQPALKCRSKEHLRLVYGPRYDCREAHEFLISRNAKLARRNKHRRILRQFALSMEAVTRFVQRNPLDAVHESILGVLAQEVAPAMSI